MSLKNKNFSIIEECLKKLQKNGYDIFIKITDDIAVFRASSKSNYISKTITEDNYDRKFYEVAERFAEEIRNINRRIATPE